ncbi:MAG: preprotein translocase subunit SecA [Burkholderiaceae bacterium]|jgi:preprotein translocase subunit SecA|nr:preprotein translocase subunit SecA [Betaproteobacteria bacterium]
MISSLLSAVFGSRNQRLIKKYQAKVDAIGRLESGLQSLSDEALAAQTDALKARHAAGESLEALLPEAFATCREASRRVLGMRHFDVQLIGGMVLHEGKIAEMRTGEGKTLMATLPAYLNALTGKGVHVVTVNEYLAQRDADWMGRLYGFLKLTTGVNLSGLDAQGKQAAYAADITYGTNNEFGFDYLRDNMVAEKASRSQRALHFAIIDEVDSILIDEARTPLIISGQADDTIDLYRAVNDLPSKLERQTAEDGPGDYFVDEKGRQVHLSDAGFEKSEQLLEQMGVLPAGASLYDSSNITLLHHLMAALRAHVLYFKDQHYVVQAGKVVIVDEFTGRLMSGRRWSDGLHQAVEAKEGVAIEAENQTLASITFQNYFRMYGKLAGMTGTADTEAFEFQQIYGLETVIVPTHRPMVRQDLQDQIFRTTEEKTEAIVADIRARHEKGQPILVGTTSIESSEALSAILKSQKLDHQVLNAKQHAREAEIVAQAGRPGMITIATNMAGRGTDIVLGGNIEKAIQAIEQGAGSDQDKARQIAQMREEWAKTHEQVLAAGGLHIIGTERHESRRIDNQLRGRAGRQGDPGSSRFYLSMDDPLLRIFAGERMKAIMDRLGVPRGEAIEAGMVTRSIESAQRKVENRNFEIRKQLLDYDNVANDQRKIIYAQRNEILESQDLSELIARLRDGAMTAAVRQHVPIDSIEEQWDLPALSEQLEKTYRLSIDLAAIVSSRQELDDQGLVDLVCERAAEAYAQKIAPVPEGLFHDFERSVLLQHLDSAWREHLAALDHLRQGIHLRGYAQKDPKQEYKREAFHLFESLLERVRDEVIALLMSVEVASEQEIAQAAEQAQAKAAATPKDLSFNHPDFNGQDDEAATDDQALTAASQTVRREFPKVGRNDPCPCGSGQKFKNCHGALK